MPKQELQNHIAWCFQRFAELSDYFDHDRYFNHFNDAIYIQYSTVELQVTFVECDERAVHTVCCTRSTRWRRHKPPRNDTVLIWMGMCSYRHFKTTAGCRPAQLMCLFVVDNAETSVNAFVALVQTFATGPISQPASMVIVEERHQPPIKPLDNGSYRRRSVFSRGTTHVICISMIQEAIHLLPLTPLTGRAQWCCSSRIDLNDFNLV